MKKCIYCNKHKDEQEFSLEHIFPAALGGKYLDDALFKTHNVCKECNNKFGLYIDGLFLRSFFVKNEAFNHYLDYYQKGMHYTIPFVFIGTLQQPTIKHPDYKYCDFWVWVGGSRVYHFHNNYNEFFRSYVSGHPIKFKSKKEAGEAYLVGVKEDISDDLFLTMLFSFQEHFQYQKRFSVNMKLKMEDLRDKKRKKIAFFDEPHEKNKKVIENILKVINVEHHTNISFQEGSEWKFLAKLAIGLGYNLFGEAFLQTKEYKTFLEIINIRDFKALKEKVLLDAIMSNFFSPKIQNFKQMGEILAFESGHTLIFQLLGKRLFFIMYLYNKEYSYVVQIVENISNYESQFLKEFKQGFVYICIPALQKGIGPIDLGAYLAWRLGDNSFLQQNHKELLNHALEIFNKNKQRF